MFLAHSDLYFKADILHRDISLWNLMLKFDRHLRQEEHKIRPGLLVDLDLYPRQSQRQGRRGVGIVLRHGQRDTDYGEEQVRRGQRLDGIHRAECLQQIGTLRLGRLGQF